MPKIRHHFLHLLGVFFSPFQVSIHILFLNDLIFFFYCHVPVPPVYCLKISILSGCLAMSFSSHMFLSLAWETDHDKIWSSSSKWLLWVVQLCWVFHCLPCGSVFSSSNCLIFACTWLIIRSNKGKQSFYRILRFDQCCYQ